MVLQSRAEDQISWEDEQLKHGVFMHHVLKGLSGEADGNRNGRVTLGELYEYASDETKLFVANRFPGELQVPSLHGKISGDVEQSTKGLCSTSRFRDYLGKAVAAAIASEIQVMLRKNG